MSSWVLPLIIVFIVVLLCSSATAAMVFVHRERLKRSLNHRGHGNNHQHHQGGGPNTQHTCKLLIPSSLITLTSQSPRFRLKLARSNASVNRSQTCERLNKDFQTVSSPVSGSSVRNSYRMASTDDLYRRSKQTTGFQDRGEGAFLEIAPKVDNAIQAAKGQRMSSYQEPKRKRKHLIYATMRRMRLFSGIQHSAATEKSNKATEGKSHLSGLRSKKARRGESEEESDYAYIDRSTHSITGYLNMEANKRSIKTPTQPQHPMSTFMPMIEHQIENDDPMSPYATTQVILTDQHLNQEVILV